uniref:Uncharacterized protein n=1 Tax=Seriola lalandi dorsalis TaxID=1841481 RepID=A0A3B4XLY1_SERLL
MSLEHLRKRLLLEAAQTRQNDDVRALMANGAPCSFFVELLSPLFLQLGCHHPTSEALLRAGVDICSHHFPFVSLSLLCSFLFSAPGGAVHLCRAAPTSTPKDMLKMTPLHRAAQHGHREVAELLLRYGADVHHCLSKFDKTPFRHRHGYQQH